MQTLISLAQDHKVPANKSATQDKVETIAFRTDLSTRLRLEAVQHDQGHAFVSDTLREAVNEYIARHTLKAAS